MLFASSGPLAKAVMAAGWSPAAVTSMRIALAAVLPAEVAAGPCDGRLAPSRRALSASARSNASRQATGWRTIGSLARSNHRWAVAAKASTTVGDWSPRMEAAGQSHQHVQ
jgi:hypothetical protein